MANKFTTKVTNEGLNLLQLASQQDKKVEFINVIASSTAYSENQLISETYDDINSRASKNQTGTINNLTIDKNITKMELVFDGHDIKSDYTLNSIFLIAKLKDSQDLKLFAIIKANQPQYMNSYDGSGSTNLQINLGVKFSNNDKVTLQIDTAAIATLGDLSNLRNETQAKIDNKLSQIKLYPEAFENGDAIKQAYPDGKTGIFIAIDTGHQWYWLNGAWKDAGPYQDNTSIKDFVDNYLSDIAHKDSDGKFKLNLDNTLTSETMPTSAKRVGELFKFNFRNYSRTYSWYNFKGKVPIIELQGDLPADASQKKSLSYKYEIFEGTATLKWQGQSSIGFPKKNFTIKFDKKFTAKDGWLADDTYVLKGNFNDFSQARNVVSAEIWAEIVKSRNWNYVPLADNDGSLIVDNTTNGFNVYEDIMPGLHGTGAVDGFPVMLVVNGDYCGLYSFVLKKKAETFGFGNSNLEYALSCERTPDNQNRNSDRKSTRLNSSH